MEIGVVLVTYNRLTELKKALSCYEKQTKQPSYLIVVDNASTDGTGAYLDQWAGEQEPTFPRTVVHCPKNLGGAGGFHTGLAAAMEREVPWIWIGDDDAYPREDALAVADAFLEKHPEEQHRISALCAEIRNHGAIDRDHRRRVSCVGPLVLEKRVPLRDYEKDVFSCQIFSYVGCILSRERLSEVGLTLSEYFIWFDDTEHSLRLSRAGEVLCLPAMKVDHDAVNPVNAITWKMYYGERNKLDMYRRHFPGIRYRFFRRSRLTVAWICGMLPGKWKWKSRIMTEAIKDADDGKLGLHEVYRPGWKPRE